MQMRDDWLDGLLFGLWAGAAVVIGAAMLAAVIWAAVSIGREILRIVR